MTSTPISRRSFIGRLAAVPALSTKAWAVDGTPPNVLLIVTRGCLSARQHLAGVGPIPALARESTRFRHAYATSPAATSARVGLVGGLYATPEPVSPERWPLVDALVRGGYRTGVVGPCAPSLGANLVLPRDTRGAWLAEAEGFVARKGRWLLVVDMATSGGAEAWPGGVTHECTDAAVGGLLEVLNGQRLSQKTVVVLVGEPSPGVQEGRGTGCEASLRVPLLIRWPGVAPAGTVSEALVSTADILPTLCAAARCECPAVAGHSLRGPLAGDLSGWRRVLCGLASHSLAAWPRRHTIRDERFRLTRSVHRLKSGASQVEYELYDLMRDPDETQNLAGVPFYRSLELSLRWRLEAWCERVGQTTWGSTTI